MTFKFYFAFLSSLFEHKTQNKKKKIYNTILPAEFRYFKLVVGSGGDDGWAWDGAWANIFISFYSSTLF